MGTSAATASRSSARTGGQPRRHVVVVGAHRAAQHDQPGVAGQIGGQLVAGIRARTSQLDARPRQPLAQRADRVVAVVLDDQDWRADRATTDRLRVVTSTQSARLGAAAVATQSEGR